MSESASYVIEHTCEEVVDKITTQMQRRSVRATNELRNAELLVLRGRRSGRMYRVPNTKARYRASAPGEPPAVRTGHFRLRWQRKHYATPSGSGKSMTVHSAIQSNVTVSNGQLLGEILEDGTSKMAPRPYKDKIIEKAEPKIVKIYKEPYL